MHAPQRGLLLLGRGDAGIETIMARIIANRLLILSS
jgi:hypothetical protein